MPVWPRPPLFALANTNVGLQNAARTVDTPSGGKALMHHSHDPALEDYPHGRGYGHDYMRGGEVLGGYGYAEREEFEKRRGELTGEHEMSAETDTEDLQT